jgi:hypothetical protein
MSKKMTGPANSMADQQGVDLWRFDVKGDLPTPVKRALKRMQPQQQTAKELQC